MHFPQQRNGFWVLLGFGLLAPAVLSCDRVSVTSVAVATVNVIPASVELVTGQVMQLSVRALDGSGTPLSSGGVQWSTSPAEIAQIDVSGRLVALAPGTATISATTGGVVGTASVAVGIPGLLALSSTELSFAAIAGAAPPPQTVNVGVSVGLATSLGTKVIYGSSQNGWLTLALSSDRAPATLTFTPTIESLAVGEYTATVQVLSESASNSPLEIDVSLTVEKTVIQLSPDTLAMSGSETQSVGVANSGAGQLSGLTAVVEYDPGAPVGWLTAGLGSSAAPATLAVISNDLSLPPGNYSARVVVGSTVPGVDPVVLAVTLQGGQHAPLLSVTPDTVRLTASQGNNATTAVNVTNRGTGVLTGLSKAVGYAPGQATGWLSTTLSSPSAPAVLTAVANTSGLALGTYAASIEVVGSAPNSPINVPVILTVTNLITPTPSPPSGLAATLSSGPTAVTLAWTDNSINETRFEVSRRIAGGAWQTVTSPGANVRTYVDNFVIPGGSYDYRVRACNSSGCSAWSSTVNVTVPGALNPPQAPSSPVLSVLSAIDIDMVWTDNASNTESFDLDRRGATGVWSRIATLANYTLTYRDTGLTPGVQYRYRIRACNTDGCSAFSAVSQATTQNPTTIPKSPKKVKIQEASRQQVVVGWNDVSFDETHFLIEQGSLTTSWVVIGQAGVNLTSFVDTNVVTGRQIFYRVSACNPVGCSGAVTVSVTVP